MEKEWKSLPDQAGRWWNQNTDTLHWFHKFSSDLPLCEREMERGQTKYIVWEHAASKPWFGPLELPTNPSGV